MLPYTLSYSTIKRFKNCPYQFLKYFEDRKAFKLPAPYTVAGNAWHKIMEIYAGKEVPSEQELQSQYEFFWRIYSKDNFAGSPLTLAPRLRRAGLAYIPTVRDRLSQIQNASYFFKELNFVVLFGTAVKVNAKIDLYCDKMVVDYKFSKHLDYMDEFQIYLYILCLHVAGFDVESAYYDFIPLDKKIAIPVNEDVLVVQLNKFKGIVKQIEGCLEADDFPAEPSDLKQQPCKWCEYKSKCIYAGKKKTINENGEVVYVRRDSAISKLKRKKKRNSG